MPDAKVVLDGDDMRRTLVRIAHEIVEQRRRARAARASSASTAAARILAARIHALLGDLLEREVPLGDLDISFYRDDVAHARRPAGRPRVAHRLRRSTARPS